MVELNETHDPSLTSWVETADNTDCDFPIQNLPFGVFSSLRCGAEDSPRVGVAIGRSIVDIAAAFRAGLLDDAAAAAASLCSDASLNRLMEVGQRDLSALRKSLSQLLRAHSDVSIQARECLVPMDMARLHIPANIRNFTDFYTSIDHAINAGRMMRPDGSLVPNFKHLPIAYHGRASSVGVSGTACVRPSGQIRPPDVTDPTFKPTAKLDYEAEVGFFVRRGNQLGEPIPISEAESHIFGLCLINDWSARDIQAWESAPLGPFLGKNFLTTVSPWVVTLEALAPFRVARVTRDDSDPEPLPYLYDPDVALRGGINIELSVAIETKRSRSAFESFLPVASMNFATQYWTIFQMLAHHTSNGCNVMVGDLIGSGTVSGPHPNAAGCLFEASQNGTVPIQISPEEWRSFLEDGDEVVIRGICRHRDARTIGFGDCRGRVQAAWSSQ